MSDESVDRRDMVQEASELARRGERFALATAGCRAAFERDPAPYMPKETRC